MRILFAVILMISGLAYAGGRDEGYKICKSFSFESDKQACVEKLKNYRYFNEAAVATCLTLSFDSDRMACVDAIGDKNFADYEIENCNSKNFPSDKLKCLQSAGEGYRPEICVNRDLLLQELSTARRTLNGGDYKSTEKSITGMIDSLLKCH